MLKTEELENNSSQFRRKVDKVLIFLRDYLVRRNRNMGFKAVSFIEVGSSGSLHCHVVVALKDRSQRSLIQVQNFIDRKWARLIRHNEVRVQEFKQNPKLNRIRSFVAKAMSDRKYEWELDRSIADVRLITNLDGVLRYSSKQLRNHEVQNQFCSLMLH